MPLRVRDPLPSLEGAIAWLGGAEPTAAELRGRPVLVHFWSISCYVCHDVARHVADWRVKYEPLGMIFIAIHQPRGPEEKNVESVTADAQGPMDFTHRAAIDNELQIVGRFENQFVPAYYVFDRDHRLRHFQAGDKSYELIDAAIERVLAEVPQTAKA